MTTQATMLKIAYLKGLERSAEAHADELGSDVEMIKEALLGSLAKGALKWGVGKPLGGALKWGVGKPLGALGRAAGGQALNLAGRVGREGYRLGKNLLGFGTSDPSKMSLLFRGATLGGRHVPATMLQYGGFGGLMGGLTGGQPGEGWSWSGAGKGFLGGAAGGLGWAAGGRLARRGLSKMLATKPFQAGRLAGFAERGRRVWGLGAKQPGFWAQRISQKGPGQTFKQLWKTPSGPAGQSVLRGLGQSAKDIGTKAALGVPIAAGFLGGSTLAEEGASHALGKPGAAMTPQAWARRGYYTMTPGGRMAYRG